MENRMRPELETLKNIIASTITIGIGTAIFYISGVFYNAGFLETLNIEPSLFSQTFEETIFTGGITLFSKYLTVLLSLALFLLVPFLVFSTIWEAKDSRVIKYIFKKAPIPATQPELHKDLQELKDKSRSYFALGLALFLVIFSVVIVLNSSLKSGTADAYKRVSEQTKNPEIYNSKITFNDKSSIEGYIIRCSDTACALLNNSIATIFQLAEASKIEQDLTKRLNTKNKK
jgi:hypothetical protein